LLDNRHTILGARRAFWTGGKKKKPLHVVQDSEPARRLSAWRYGGNTPVNPDGHPANRSYQRAHARAMTMRAAHAASADGGRLGHGRHSTFHGIGWLLPGGPGPVGRPRSGRRAPMETAASWLQHERSSVAAEGRHEERGPTSTQQLFNRCTAARQRRAGPDHWLERQGPQPTSAPRAWWRSQSSSSSGRA
jgi:hypothetical protein